MPKIQTAQRVNATDVPPIKRTRNGSVDTAYYRERAKDLRTQTLVHAVSRLREVIAHSIARHRRHGKLPPQHHHRTGEIT